MYLLLYSSLHQYNPLQSSSLNQTLLETMPAKPQFIPNDVIGELVFKPQQLTCSIPKMELDDNIKEAMITGSTKLIDKFFCKKHIQKYQVVNAINKA